MYPEIMVVGMRDELKKMGVTELRTEEEVDRALTNQKGTAMVVVNSICGCAAGRMGTRAAAREARRLRHGRALRRCGGMARMRERTPRNPDRMWRFRWADCERQAALAER